MIWPRPSLAVASVVLALSACGNQREGGGEDPGPGATPAGCAESVAPITEPTDFVPYYARLSHDFRDGQPMRLETVTESTTIPTGVATTFDGLALVGIDTLGGTTAAYGEQIAPGSSRSEFLADGGVLVYRYQTTDTSIARSLKNERQTGDQVNLVAVGPHQAAVTWSDPDEDGLRSHHVIWHDAAAQADVNVERVAEPEALVAAARRWVC